MSRDKSKVVHLADKFALRLYGCETPQLRLICFPFIAGNARHFRPMSRYIPADWQLCAVTPPGREVARGKAITDIEELVDLYASHLRQWCQGQFYIFGHSLGGIISYLLLQMWERAGIAPAGAFISASAPPHKVIEEMAKADDYDHWEILEQIDSRYALLSRKAYLFNYSALYDADYKLLQSLRFEATKPTTTPLHIIFSPEDNLFDLDTIEQWHGYGHRVDFTAVCGTHNYILTYPQLVVEKIKELVSR